MAGGNSADSREAAAECSPGRKPGDDEREMKSPERAKEPPPQNQVQRSHSSNSILWSVFSSRYFTMTGV